METEVLTITVSPQAEMNFCAVRMFEVLPCHTAQIWTSQVPTCYGDKSTADLVVAKLGLASATIGITH